LHEPGGLDLLPDWHDVLHQLFDGGEHLLHKRPAVFERNLHRARDVHHDRLQHELRNGAKWSALRVRDDH
jgi:hypothetical protein